MKHIAKVYLIIHGPEGEHKGLFREGLTLAEIMKQTQAIQSKYLKVFHQEQRLPLEKTIKELGLVNDSVLEVNV